MEIFETTLLIECFKLTVELRVYRHVHNNRLVQFQYFMLHNRLVAAYRTQPSITDVGLGNLLGFPGWHGACLIEVDLLGFPGWHGGLSD